MKTLFPNQAWTDFALAQVKASKLDQFHPADAPDFYLDGSAEAWVHLLAAMAKHESGFDPNQTYNESGDLAGVVSVGLLQLSQQSVRAYAKYAYSDAIAAELKTITTAKLKDPFLNIKAAITILKRWVSADGMIDSDSAPWQGGGRYWSVLRKGSPKVKATLKQIYSNLTVVLPSALSSAKLVAALPVADAGNIPSEVQRAFNARNNAGSKCNWIFEVDYSINSKFPRLFVYSIKDAQLFKYKCAHGRGGKNEAPHDGVTREVSNKAGSMCSSLGVIRTGNAYTSEKVGQAVKLNGLSPTNSNIFPRGIVLHGGDYVPDNLAGNNREISGRSEGCIVVSTLFIDRAKGGELIDRLKDGSIGVAHYGGEFKIQG